MKKIILWGFNRQIAEEIGKSGDIKVLRCFFERSKINKCRLDLDKYKPYDKNVYNQAYKFLDTYYICRNRPKQIYLRPEKFYDYVDFFNIYFQYFYNILEEDKPDALFFDNIPHIGPDVVFYAIAKAMGVKCVLFHQTLFANKVMYCSEVEKLGDAEHMMKLSDDTLKIEKKFKKNLFYMKKKRFGLGIFKNIRVMRHLYLSVVNLIKLPYTLAYRKRLKEHTTSDVDMSKNFVYFPLHLQPEMTTDSLGGIFSDQMLAIERVSEMLPEGWFVYVKENPYQDEFRRGRCFFQRLRMLKNVRLVPNETSTYELMEKSKFVATITGTAGWEALTGGRNVLAFGCAWYGRFPGAFRYSPDLKLDDIVNYSIDHSELQAAFDKYYQCLGDAVVVMDYRKMVKDFDAKKNSENVASLVGKLTRDWNPR